MLSETPMFKRCLICLPLRFGLIAWGCIRLIISFLIMTFSCHVLLEGAVLSQSKEENFRVVPSIMIFIFLIAVVSMFDLIMTIFLIVACKKKNVEVLRIYYMHSKFMATLTVGWSIYYVGLTIFNLFTINYKYLSGYLVITELMDIISYFSVAGLHIYIMLLVQSEIVMLDSGCELTFVKNITDAECTLNVKDLNEEKITE